MSEPTEFILDVLEDDDPLVMHYIPYDGRAEVTEYYQILSVEATKTFYFDSSGKFDGKVFRIETSNILHIIRNKRLYYLHDYVRLKSEESVYLKLKYL